MLPYTYLAFDAGEESFMADSAVNLWRADLQEDRIHSIKKEQAECILKALFPPTASEFGLNQELWSHDEPNKEILLYPACVNAAVSLSGERDGKGIESAEQISARIACD